ncbi:MAG: RebB family R body protein [Algicola sp.]|nr:RebB family R body protein [Algicola sp.]
MPVNEQVTDSVTQVNTATLASTPAMGMGNLLMSTSQAMATTALNATGSNQQGGIVMQSVTVQGINSLMSTCTAVLGRGAEEILEKKKAK